MNAEQPEREETINGRELTRAQRSEYDDSVKVKSYTLDWLIGLRRAQFTRNPFTETGAFSLALTAAKEVLTLRQTDVKLHLWRRSGTWRPFFETTYRRETTKGKTDASLEFVNAPNTDFVVDGLSVPGNTYTVRGGVTLRKWLGAYTLEYEYRRSPRQSRHVADLRVRFE
jgi:hypothetical protein